MMKFESIPNEILLECFTYFNAPDLFNAFDNLNDRFQRLIESVSLSVYFRDVKKSTFDQFCSRILLNPKIKRQVHSLQLSNEWKTSGQIESFLSLFSLNEFDHLRSVTLINVKTDQIPTFECMLSSISNLSYFAYYSKTVDDTMFSSISLCSLRKLVLEHFAQWSLLTQQRLVLTHVTLINCYAKSYCALLQKSPILKYLKINNLSEMTSLLKDGSNIVCTPAMCLVQLDLTINDELDFEHMEILLQQKPKLKILILSVPFGTDELFEARRWQNFLSLSFPCLHTLKLYISVQFRDEDVWDWASEGSFNKLEQFQTDFWTRQHHWQIAYQIENNSISLFTLPYMKNNYMITSQTVFFCKDLSMDNVEHLALRQYAMVKQMEMNFPKIKSLTFERQPLFRPEGEIDLPVTDTIDWLRTMINLSNLQRLIIGYECRMTSPSALLEIFKETPRLSSMSIYRTDLLPLLENTQLCSYFDKMITDLTIGENLFDGRSFDQLEPVWGKFSNLERLECDIRTHSDLLVLLKRLPKLLNLSVSKITSFRLDAKVWIEENISELNGDFLLDADGNRLHLWIGKQTTASSSY